VTDERPGPDALSDDARDREPLRDRADNPPEAGTRSDLGGTGTGDSGASPGGDAAVREAAVQTQDREGRPPGGQGTSSGGGYGVGSDASSGGSGEGTERAGEETETEWLRDAGGGPDN
jgi:hypothetical protein